MMKCAIAVATAIDQLKQADQRLSYRNLEAKTEQIRGKKVSMRSMRRTPIRQMIEDARGTAPGTSKARPSAAGAKPSSSEEIANRAIAKRDAEIAHLLMRIAQLEAGHRERRRPRKFS